MAGFSFPKTSRLLSAKDYRQVFGARPYKQQFTSAFKARIVKNNHTHGRLGLAISKKHLKRAVDRNRIKRLVRESYRQNKKSLLRLDVVILSQAAVVTTPNHAILAQLEQLWKELSRFSR